MGGKRIPGHPPGVPPCPINSSSGQSSPSCWDVVMIENVTWTLRGEVGAALLNRPLLCLTFSLLPGVSQGARVIQQERERGRLKPVILRGHFIQAQ